MDSKTETNHTNSVCGNTAESQLELRLIPGRFESLPHDLLEAVSPRAFWLAAYLRKLAHGGRCVSVELKELAKKMKAKAATVRGILEELARVGAIAFEAIRGAGVRIAFAATFGARQDPQGAVAEDEQDPQGAVAKIPKGRLPYKYKPANPSPKRQTQPTQTPDRPDGERETPPRRGGVISPGTRDGGRLAAAIEAVLSASLARRSGVDLKHEATPPQRAAARPMAERVAIPAEDWAKLREEIA